MGSIFRGTGVALVTPFKEDGSIDFDALTRLVDYQIENGTDYFVVLGTTAETATLSKEEKRAVVEAIVKQTAKRVPIMVGAGGNNTAEVCEALKSMDTEGIDAILSVAPYYSKPNQEGIFQHFVAVAEASPLPIVLYNVPSRVGVNMTAETTTRLANHSSKFIAVKEASGDLVQAAKIIRDTPEAFDVISGEDALIVPLISLGGAGVISVASNPCPAYVAKMVKAALEGDFATAGTMQRDMLQLVDLLFCEGSPTGAKAALAELGIIENNLRLPLVPLSEERHEEIADLIQQAEPALV